MAGNDELATLSKVQDLENKVIDKLEAKTSIFTTIPMLDPEDPYATKSNIVFKNKELIEITYPVSHSWEHLDGSMKHIAKYESFTFNFNDPSDYVEYSYSALTPFFTVDIGYADAPEYHEIQLHFTNIPQEFHGCYTVYSKTDSLTTEQKVAIKNALTVRLISSELDVSTVLNTDPPPAAQFIRWEEND
jgi:hypothetical protein